MLDLLKESFIPNYIFTPIQILANHLSSATGFPSDQAIMITLVILHIPLAICLRWIKGSSIRNFYVLSIGIYSQICLYRERKCLNFIIHY